MIKKAFRGSIQLTSFYWHKCFKKENLWITNTLSLGFLMGTGDGIQQQVPMYLFYIFISIFNKSGYIYCLFTRD